MVFVVYVQGKRLDQVTPTTIPFLTAVLNVVAQLQIVIGIRLFTFN
jgi:uncharacterized membrane protein YozB (DUF420 family)